MLLVFSFISFIFFMFVLCVRFYNKYINIYPSSHKQAKVKEADKE